MLRRQRGQEGLDDNVQQTMGLHQQWPVGFWGRILLHPSLEVGIALMQL